MLQGKAFDKVTAWFGILASIFTFADQISVILLPAVATPLMIFSGLFWIPWWIMISRGLFKLTRFEQQLLG
jgi:hypothetical protein